MAVNVLSLGTTFCIPESQKSCVCHLNLVMTFSCTSSSSNFFLAKCFFLHHILPILNVTINSNNLFVNFLQTLTFCVEKSYDGTHLAFGGTFDRRCHFKTYLTQTKPVLPLSNEHGSQVNDQGRRQCFHNKHKNFPIGLTVMKFTFRTRLVLVGLSYDTCFLSPFWRLEFLCGS